LTQQLTERAVTWKEARRLREVFISRPISRYETPHPGQNPSAVAIVYPRKKGVPRLAKLENMDRTSRLQHPMELAKPRERVFKITHAERDCDGIEGRIRER
jgi:hypothetical protein